MINRSFTAVVERNATLLGSFVTEPYETGWAKEARWFFRVLSAPEGATLTVRTQLSPDGLFWCHAEESAVTFAAATAGLYSLPVPANFGGWLALKGEAGGCRPGAAEGQEENAAQEGIKVIIYLTLKE